MAKDKNSYNKVKRDNYIYFNDEWNDKKIQKNKSRYSKRNNG